MLVIIMESDFQDVIIVFEGRSQYYDILSTVLV